MPTAEIKFRILLSSPSDLNEERAAIGSVVEELNRTWGDPNAASIELLSWEKSVSPGVGSEPQAVINKGLGENWDIYLGLMHTRFGTATSGFGSGTEEEFENAYKLWESDGTHRRIMFYFKKAAIDPDDIDPAQLQKVRDFRGKMSKRGGLYGTFEDVESLKGLLRVHLTKVLNELIAPYPGKQLIPIESSLARTEPEAVGGELGMLDYFEMSQGGLDSMREIFDEHNLVMGDLTKLMITESAKVKEANERHDFNALRSIVTTISSGMTSGARKLSGVRQRYAESSRVFLRA